MEARDKKAIEILLRIGSVFGVSPISSLSKTEYGSNITFTVFLLVTSSTVCVFSFYFNARDSYIGMKKIDIYVDLLSTICSSMLGTVIITGPLFSSAIWKKLLLELQNNRKLIQLSQPVNSINQKTVKVYTEIIVFHIMFIARFVWDAVVWISCHGVHIYKNYLHRIYHEYCVMISILIMVHLNIVIQNHFKLLNNALWCVVRSDFCATDKKTTQLASLSCVSFNKLNMCYSIRNLQIVYRKLSKMIDHFNTIFGYQILLLMGYTVAVALGSLHNALKYNNFNEKIDAMVLSWSVISSTIIIVSTLTS